MPWTFYNSNGQRLSSAATNISVLDIDGATEMGADIIDADLLIIDDGAGGTNRSVLASRIATYVQASTAPVFGRVVRTAGNITTTSTSLADVTGATITLTTGAYPLAYGVVQTYYHSANNGLTNFNIEIDGSTLLHGTSGLIMYEYSALYGLNGSFSGLTAALSAGSHTILEQWKVGAGTGTLYAQSTTAHTIWAHEVR